MLFVPKWCIIFLIMCQKHLLNQNITLPIALAVGTLIGFSDSSALYAASEGVADIFISLLKLVSLPIIFLSIVSTASSMGSVAEIRSLGKKVVKYTLFTTVIAATVALALFVLVDPVRTTVTGGSAEIEAIQGVNYFAYLKTVVPSNIIKPFVDNNVIGVLFLAMLLSLAILTLPEKNRTLLHGLFSSLFQAIMKVTTWIIAFIPLATAAFIALFFRDLRSGMEFESLGYYLAVVLGANLIQAVIVLPLLLKWKGVDPLKLFKAMSEALSVAFWAKSSAAALPMAVKCAEEKGNVSRKVAGFSLPLCTTINMNACAAFILITVLFVSISNGMTFSYLEMFGWVFIATIAAVGNAGVPMGCFFLSSAFLASMNVPLNILGLILPIYSLIDMLESAINVWSDSCVTAVVDQEVKEETEGRAKSENPLELAPNS